MMEVIHCVNCGNSSIEFDTVSVNVTLRKTVQPCKHCSQTRTEEQHFFFCSDKCHTEFNAKVVAGKAAYKWKEWQEVDGVMQFV